MDRRGFLRTLAGAGVAVSTKPVRFFAPVGGWRPEQTVRMFRGNLSALRLVRTRKAGLFLPLYLTDSERMRLIYLDA